MNVELKTPSELGLYLKDPQSTNLGRRIIENAILLIDEIGFEAFTFKKLAKKIQSNEASLYRYFENKHMLLVYLVNWYWMWVSFLIKINTMNINDPVKCLDIILENIVNASRENQITPYINEQKLHQIVIKESVKCYHIIEVDEENRNGYFTSFKELQQTISKAILNIDPSFPYPNSLASTLLEMVNNQLFFATHIPSLTDISIENHDYSHMVELLSFYAKRMLTSTDK